MTSHCRNNRNKTQPYAWRWPHGRPLLCALLVVAPLALAGCNQQADPPAPAADAAGDGITDPPPIDPVVVPPADPDPVTVSPDDPPSGGDSSVAPESLNSDPPPADSSAEPGEKDAPPGDVSADAPPAHSADHEEEADGHGGYGGKPAIDPVEQNGPIFVDWPQPQAAIVLSGEQFGFIEPCGCAGLENQKGGLSRRHTLIKQLEARGWPLVAADLGGQVRRFGPQAEMKYRAAATSLATLGYSAVGFGPQDLRLPAEHLVLVAADLPQQKRIFVSANVGLLDFDSGFVDRYRVVEVGGRKIGITSILGEEYHARVNNEGIVYAAPSEALPAVVEKMAAEADFLVLLSHATPEESTALAKKFPQFDVVATAGGAEEPPATAETIAGTPKPTRLVEVGHKGMYVAVLGLYDDATTPFRYQRVPLDARFEDSPEMKAMLVRYQKELETVGLDGLGVSAQAHPRGQKFVGSAVCADCHTEAYAVWEKTPHAHATQTIIDLKPARHHDPECLSCHVTGWNPQKYFPYESGYTNLEATPHLRTNGCENCHGPGSQHVAIELGELEADDDQQEAAREQMRIRLVDGELKGEVVGRVVAKCVECHDPDNSPDFKFDTYWEEVKHYGKY